MASRAVVFSAESMGRLSCLLAISIENNLKAHQKEILYISLHLFTHWLHLFTSLKTLKTHLSRHGGSSKTNGEAPNAPSHFRAEPKPELCAP